MLAFVICFQLSGEQTLELPPKNTEQKAAKARPAKPAQPKHAKTPKKLLLFDIDILAMVKAGDNTQDKLLLLTGVDPLQFAQRSDFLCSKGFLCRDSTNPAVFRLGIAGYDELAKKKTAEDKKASKTKPAEPKPGEAASESKLTERDSSIVYVPGPEHKPARQPDIDLFDLLRKGSPKNGNGMAARIQTAMAAAPQGEALPFDKQVESLGGRDAVKEMIERTTQSGACELCQAEFHLSVNPSENNPKYGYCFCGASYHKDCYEHLVNTQGSCVRCGKKLQIRMDKASEDAVKAVKKLFD